jgi:ATP phosphoribosyltransferase regulatory subunit HisZ
VEDVNKNIERLNNENVDFRRRIEKLENDDERHEKDIRALFVHQEGTKAYVTQILEKLNTLETKLFTTLLSFNKDRKEESKEDRKSWHDTVKYVIGATIGALIFYMFTKGA